VRPKQIAILVIAVLVVIILFQNLHPVTVEFLVWSPKMPLLILVTILLAIGFVLGMLTFALRKNRQ
jgi:uncharacterized integral membrane protein